MRRLLDWVVGQLRLIHEESLAPDGRSRFDARPLVVLVVVAVSLTIQEYWGQRAVFYGLFPDARELPLGSEYYELQAFGWWTFWRVFGYLILPAVVVWAMPGEKLRDYGLLTRDFKKHVVIFLVLFSLVLPFVVGASFFPGFQKTYPFYKLAHRSVFDLLVWEVMYALQFFSLEFFFRGFMLQGLRRAMGVHAIWVMVVPYCMIHYGKPMAETLGAIVAGLVLGTVAMRTRSIWSGVLAHVAVAVTMDVLSIVHTR